MKTTLYVVKLRTDGNNYGYLAFKDDEASYITPSQRHAYMFESAKDAVDTCEHEGIKDYKVNALFIVEQEIISATITS